jgi:hypothetical protein
MIKVKWLKAHYKFAYSKGDIGYVTPENAAMLLEGGFVITLPEEKEETKVAEKQVKTNPLPADLPARSILFASGFDSIVKIKEAGDSLLDAGISVSTLKKVKKYIVEKYKFE